MLEVIDDRNCAIAALSSAYFARLSLSPSEMADLLPGWQFYALQLSGEIVGAVAIKGDAGHIGILPAWRGKWGGAKALSDLCRYFEVTKTSVAHDNQKSMLWLERCGWVRTGSDEFGVNYALR